jgi:hypothetical protein
MKALSLIEISTLSVNIYGLCGSEPFGESVAATSGEPGGLILAETCALSTLGVEIRKSVARLDEIEKTSSSGELQTVFMFLAWRSGVLVFGVLLKRRGVLDLGVLAIQNGLVLAQPTGTGLTLLYQSSLPSPALLPFDILPRRETQCPPPIKLERILLLQPATCLSPFRSTGRTPHFRLGLPTQLGNELLLLVRLSAEEYLLD